MQCTPPPPPARSLVTLLSHLVLCLALLRLRFRNLILSRAAIEDAPLNRESRRPRRQARIPKLTIVGGRPDGGLRAHALQQNLWPILGPRGADGIVRRADLRSLRGQIRAIRNRTVDQSIDRSRQIRWLRSRVGRVHRNVRRW